MLPDVVSGTSAGALIASLLCVRTEEEFLETVSHSDELARRLVFRTESVPALIKRFFRKGHFIDQGQWAERLQWITKGNTTFLEAFQRTGRALNITVTSSKFSWSSHGTKLLNYITTPNVLISSAIVASAAMPLLTGSAPLMEKDPVTGEITQFRALASTRWRDGSLSIDIPLAALTQLFDVRYTIVSQCNPHVQPFFFSPHGSAGMPSLHRQGSGWRGGFVLSTLEKFLKLDMIKWITLLRELDLIPRFGGEDWGNLFLQQFFGNVTILPRHTLLSVLHVISDGTPEWFDWYRITGERATWPKLSMIANHMRIEQALRRLFAKHNVAGLELYPIDRRGVHPVTPTPNPE
jgi:predicted acylesterase/phospholipase RssA